MLSWFNAYTLAIHPMWRQLPVWSHIVPQAPRGPLQADALHQFVEKEEKAALADCLSSSLAATLSVSMANEETADAIDRGLDLSALLRQAAAQRRTQLVPHVC